MSKIENVFGFAPCATSTQPPRYSSPDSIHFR
ncbi:hypothetical protein BOSEA1005_12898 [Hyphomicrobiales bacterium]|nr:hypothetical protein BOSEA1005_12898 [Hyphomicrobiales bacterium]